MKVGFHIIGAKGLQSLKAFFETFGGEAVGYVMAARDAAIEYDAFDDIEDYCKASSLAFCARGGALYGVDEQCDAIFAIGWRWLIDETDKLIVFHDSPLPRYRGFAPLVNMLIDGCDEIAVTALLAADQYDRGDIVAQATMPITYPLKIADAIDQAASLYAKLVVEVGGAILTSGSLQGQAQDEANASYSLWRDDADYRVDFSRSAVELRRFIDAVGYPYKGASALVGGLPVRLLDAVALADVNVENRQAHLGKVIFMEGNYPVVVCGSGLLKITELRDEQGASLLGKLKFRTRFEGC